jgi:hypothetical protein
MARRIAPLDVETLFAEDLTLAASDVVQKDAVDRVLTIGKGRSDFTWVVDVTGIEIASNDELYTFLLQGSNVANFASGIVNLGMMQFGATEVLLGGAGDSVIGRYMQSVSNDFLADYKYVRLNVIIAGTVATGITFSSWLTKTQVAN